VKTVAPVVFLAVVLHYVFVAGMSSRIDTVRMSVLILFTLCAALFIFVASGFGDRE
jgi:hypothetical protein